MEFFYWNQNIHWEYTLHHSRMTISLNHVICHCGSRIIARESFERAYRQKQLQHTFTSRQSSNAYSLILRQSIPKIHTHCPLFIFRPLIMQSILLQIQKHTTYINLPVTWFVRAFFSSVALRSFWPSTSVTISCFLVRFCEPKSSKHLRGRLFSHSSEMHDTLSVLIKVNEPCLLVPSTLIIINISQVVGFEKDLLLHTSP